MRVRWQWDVHDLTPRTIDGIEGVATQIRFTLTGKANGRAESITGSWSPALDALGDGLVEWADLTPKIVTGWLNKWPGAAALKAQITEALAEAPAEPEPTLPALPWANEGEA